MVVTQKWYIEGKKGIYYYRICSEHIMHYDIDDQYDLKHFAFGAIDHEIN